LYIHTHDKKAPRGKDQVKIPSLKPNSPEFAEQDKKTKTQNLCNHLGCLQEGEHRAPKSPHNLTEHYWFCSDHITEYNKSWNYTKNMGKGEVEHQIYSAMYWDRPTWKMSAHPLSEERLRKRIYESFHQDGMHSFFDRKKDQEEQNTKRRQFNHPNIPGPEIDALKTMDLNPPVEWDEIRAQYKTLVKLHHPDLNQDKTKAEELIKQINLAYSILKIAYQRYSKLENRDT
jgi:curved DNA-binding protein CbpA